MPLFGSLEAESAGPISRKRTHAQITRSSSRSITPPPSKRRRTSTNQFQPARQLSRERTASATPPPRFVGDGLDFRRPTASAMEQAQEHTTIDLTLDSDDDEDVSVTGSLPPSSRATSSSTGRRSRRSTRPRLRPRNDEAHSRAPPFDQNQHQGAREIIDLSSSDVEEDHGGEGHRTRAMSLASSPEVQIVGERHIVRRSNLPPVADLVGEPPGLQRADAQTFRHTTFAGTIQQMATNIMGGFASGNAPPDFGRFIPMPPHLRNFREYFRRSADIPASFNPEIYDDDDDFGSVFLDYERGGLEILDPGDQDGAPAVSDYKPPPPAREGFTRNIEEDNTEDVLVCVGCEEELTTGDADVKQQVWVLKKCGHVYCGECSSQRVSARGGNNRDRKKAKQPKLDVHKFCRAEGCKEKITARTGMFQLYL